MTWTVGHQSGNTIHHNSESSWEVSGRWATQQYYHNLDRISSTVQRDPRENMAKAYSKVMSSEKVDGIKTLSYPGGPGPPGQGRQAKAALNSGSKIGRKVWKKLQFF